jgi:hypothetical protein
VEAKLFVPPILGPPGGLEGVIVDGPGAFSSTWGGQEQTLRYY